MLDRSTGLVWEQSPLTTEHAWNDGRVKCANRGVGGQMGWRLPSFHELTSLVVPGDPAGGPDLPAGHPFSDTVQSDDYWSATANIDAPAGALRVSFRFGLVGFTAKSIINFIWCVRGGGPLSEY